MPLGKTLVSPLVQRSWPQRKYVSAEWPWPIAICETGYSSATSDVEAVAALHVTTTPAHQPYHSESVSTIPCFTRRNSFMAWSKVLSRIQSVRTVLAAASSPVMKEQFAGACVAFATVATWQDHHDGRICCDIGWL